MLGSEKGTLKSIGLLLATIYSTTQREYGLPTYRTSTHAKAPCSPFYVSVCSAVYHHPRQYQNSSCVSCCAQRHMHIGCGSTASLTT